MSEAKIKYCSYDELYLRENPQIDTPLRDPSTESQMASGVEEIAGSSAQPLESNQLLPRALNFQNEPSSISSEK